MTELRRNEKIIKKFEVIKSVHGKGTFYITNYGVYFKSQKYGIIIKINFECLKSYNAVKKETFQIVWNTHDNNRVIYEMEVDSAEEIAVAYREINKEYAESKTEIQTLKLKHDTIT